MKCEENGGCPMLYQEDGDWSVNIPEVRECLLQAIGVKHKDCRLTSASFPAFRAVLEGKGWMVCVPYDKPEGVDNEA